MKTYTGKILSNGAKVVVVTMTRPGTDLKVNYSLPHIMLHSAGLEWGYGGSGPHDLSISLLADYLGETPEQVVRFWNYGKLGERCPECQGEGFHMVVTDRMDEERPCEECDGEGAIYPAPCQSWELHGLFTWNVVAKWPQDEPWIISELELAAFVALDQKAGLPPPEVEV